MPFLRFTFPNCFRQLLSWKITCESIGVFHKKSGPSEKYGFALQSAHLAVVPTKVTKAPKDIIARLKSIL